MYQQAGFFKGLAVKISERILLFATGVLGRT